MPTERANAVPAASCEIAPLLRVEDLCVDVAGEWGTVRVVDEVRFEIGRGECLALVGESGCGKSLTALALMSLLPSAARVAGGRIVLNGIDLLSRPESERRAVRGRRMAMIFQEPATALNPLMTAGAQVAEALAVHCPEAARTRRARREAVLAMLERVRLTDPAACIDRYPHQLSGGQRQRVMIAIALAGGADLLIADEPTTALDVTVEAEILSLLGELRRTAGLALLFITHDLDVVSVVADRVAVIYAGRIVEQGPSDTVFSRPLHPYTSGLVACVPRIDPGDGPTGQAGRRAPLPQIEGVVAQPGARPGGCRFHPRCSLGRDDRQCREEEPGVTRHPGGREARCWKVEP